MLVNGKIIFDRYCVCTRIAILIYGFLFINIWLLILCDTGIYAIIEGSNTIHYQSLGPEESEEKPRG